MARVRVEDAAKLPSSWLAAFASGEFEGAIRCELSRYPAIDFAVRWTVTREHGNAWIDYRLEGGNLRSIFGERLPSRLGHGTFWRLSCPDCNRSRKDLYLTRGRPWFACRECHGLLYRSQQYRRTLERAEHGMIQAARRIDPSIDAALALDALPERPHGMPLRTYERIATRYERAELIWLQRAAAEGAAGLAAVESALEAMEMDA